MNRKQIAENIDELGSSALSAKYICRSCTRVAKDKERLCKAQTISNGPVAPVSDTMNPDFKLATTKHSLDEEKEVNLVQKAVTLAKEKRRNTEKIPGAQSTCEILNTLKSMKKECKKLKKKIKLQKKLLKLSKKHHKLAKKHASMPQTHLVKSASKTKDVDLH